MIFEILFSIFAVINRKYKGMKRVSSSQIKCLRFITGIYPIIHSISCIVDSLMAIIDMRSLYPYYAIMDASLIFGIVLFMLSNIFKFCLWHRFLVVNIIVCSILDYANETYRCFMDGYTILYLILFSSFSFSLGSIISLFFKNREINGKQ